MDLIVNQTRDATRSVFNGVPRHAIANTEDDHGRPGMQDYAVEMLALPILTVLDGVTGLVVVEPVDFGVGDGKTVLEVVLRLKNAGGGVLELGTLVVAGMDYELVAQPPQTSLLPGETTPVSLRMVGDESGTYLGTLTIPSNDASSPRVVDLVADLNVDNCHPLGVEWAANATLAGGTYTADQRAMICALAEQLAGKAYYERLWLLAPFAGSNKEAMLVPLINRMRDSAAAADGTLKIYNVGLEDVDFAADQGVTNASATKYLALGVGSLAAALEGKDPEEAGFGYWELNTAGPILGRVGCADERLAGLGRSWVAGVDAAELSLRRGFLLQDPTWGSSLSVALVPSLNDFGHKHLTYAKFTRNGVLLSTDTTVGSAVFPTCRALLMAWGQIPFGAPAGPTDPIDVFAGAGTRLGCFYIRGGEWSEAELLDLYVTLRDYLMVPTGRVAP